MANDNDRYRGAAAGGTPEDGGSPIPAIKNPAVTGARPRRNYRLPWVLLGLALLAAILMLTQCGRDEGKVDEAVARDRAAQQQPNAAPAERRAALPAPGTFRQGTLAYDVNQYLISNARGERSFAFAELQFDPGSAEIRDADQSDIATLAQALAARPGTRAAVVGYADARGGDAANTRLGAERARAVIAALRRRGVETSNIEARSGGELDRPAGSDSARGLARSRRAEFVLLAR